MFVCFSDTRENHDYSESHVITAKFAPRVRLILLSCFQWFNVKLLCFVYFQNDIGAFTIPNDAELETKEHVVIYDSNTSSLKDKSKPCFDTIH